MGYDSVTRRSFFILICPSYLSHDNNSISRKDYTMDQLAELLKSMTDEEAKKVLSQLPTLLKATTQESQNADAKTADESAHDASADSTRVEQILSIDEDAPLTEALGVPETSTRAQEKKLKREQQQKEKELKKQQEQKEKELKKEQERRERELKKEQEQRERELKKEQEHREKEEARLKKLEEKEQQKKELEEKRAAEREARLSEKLERENARLSAKLEKENQRLEAQKAANASKAQPTASLSAFGFVSNTIKLDDNSDKLFSQFVQDKRIVPEALRFWEDGTTKEGAESENCAKSCLSEASNALFSIMSDGHLDNEESSLLHPLCKDVSIIEKQKFSSFNAMIEASNTQPAKTSNLCSCGFHANSKPFDLFNDELIYINFSAIGYEPCQSRPPYFGTFNTIQNGGLSNVELFQMARFSLDQEMPRLCNVDYEYDSGDDWDVADGDDISSTSTDDSDGANSLESTELDFINDDDGSDSEDGWQRKTMEARQRRMNRLKGKEKLIPAFSGPFVGIPCSDHPLRSYDRLQRVTPLTGVFFTALLEAEIRAHNNFSSSGATAEDIALGDEQQKLVAAALNNRQREMSESELSALDLIVKANAKISMKGILDALNQQQLCVGVAKSEVFRTVRRFYERRHGMYIKRDKPWEPTDERLFQKRKTARSANDPQDGDDGDDCEEPTPSGTNAGGVQRLEDLPAFNMPVSNTIE
ncbi:hypothetical protein AGDE_07680 [Angomonas deanei]|uniref:Chromatin assembly factor 1 subunit A, putative n=1 Tax=Angomonas deanei TaxID=59799 RepID=A0A7G2CTW7_9TRYP|nr:hypothetical protein AGDE_07680 [Angomonas deanei]CAD2222647.1 Chromatin assembly factor 1 subunit A, putative [Angomonas deanei]|eukprot:EPY34956.1 hypothetical protein AGDE_07680 [Angomonas deanei]